MIRIVGGKYRSRNIFTPDVDTTKPTKDMVREGIFSALGSSIIGANVLDLFAGSGALGIESLSRGANKALFIDNNRVAINVIKKNLLLLNENSSEAILNSYQVAMEYFKKSGATFDIVFLDPPYKENIYQEIIDGLILSGVLSTYGIIVCESDKLLEINKNYFEKIKNYSYGKSKVTILWRRLK
jgi:16S rRNA (guanine966-N2)-methyltransferase